MVYYAIAYYDTDRLADRCALYRSNKRIEFFGNVAIVAVGISALARIGYYVAYGKEGGSKALPPRRGK